MSLLLLCVVTKNARFGQTMYPTKHPGQNNEDIMKV